MPPELARGVAHLDLLFAGCAIVRVAQRAGESVGDTASAYFAIGSRFGFDWLRQAAAGIASKN